MPTAPANPHLAPAHPGGLRFEPEHALIALAPQEVRDPGADVVWLARACDRSSRVRAAFGLCELEAWPTLSSGERKRWQLAAAVAREPDVRLLDEPTNHLDAQARRWLFAELRRFRGIAIVALVMATHDAELARRCTRTRWQLGVASFSIEW